MSVVTKNPFELLGEAEDAPISTGKAAPKGKKTITIEKPAQAPSAYGTYSKENTKHAHGRQSNLPTKTGYGNPNKRVFDKKSGTGRSQGKQGGTGKGKWDPTVVDPRNENAEGGERPETPQPTTDAPEEVEEDTGRTLLDYKKNLEAPVAPREARKPQSDSKKWDDVVRIEKPVEETKKSTSESKKEDKEKKSKFVAVNPTDLIQIAPKQDRPRPERRERREYQNRDENRGERRNNQGGNQGGNTRGPNPRGNNQGGNNRGPNPRGNNQGGNNRNQGANNRGNAQNNTGKQGKGANLSPTDFPELQ